MKLETMIVQLPYENGHSNKKAVVTDFERFSDQARGVHNPRLGYHPRFVDYNELSATDKELWDKFMTMLIENMKEASNPDYYQNRKPL